MACKVHKIRYYNPKPVPVNCAALNKSSKLLALARQDASIEIWDLNFAPYLVKFIPGVANTSVEALGWVSQRLLSTGLGGALVEWDTEKLCVKNTVILTGYAAWCLDVNSVNTVVAVGTEQGYVNLYSVEYDNIVYKKLFDKQEGRIMCCKFDQTGNVLVTGSVDCIRVWNVETGHATCKMSVTRRGKETIVWCLAVLSDSTVVSGDSLGRLTFWDSNLGDQLESYTTHKRDILSIAISDDEKSLYFSGVDPVIMQFVKVNSGTGKLNSAKWVKNVQRNIHEHDVRALVTCGDKLISVGADGYLTLSSYPPKWVMRIPPMVPYPRSSVSAQKKFLLLRYSNHLEVWKLGSYEVNKSGNVTRSNNSFKKNINQETNKTHLEEDSVIIVGNNFKKQKENHEQTLKLTEQPVKLVSIQTKGKKQIKYCDLSPSGEIVVYSTDRSVRMLKLECDEDQSNVSLTKVLITGLASCDRVAFTPDSRTMVASCDGALKVLQVDPEAGATVVQTIPSDKYLKSNSILHLVVSMDTSSNVIYLAVADAQSYIAVWIKKTNKFEFHAALPKYRCVPSAMAIDDKTNILIVVYVDQKIIEYHLENQKISKCKAAEHVPEWCARTAPVLSVTTHPLRDALVMQDDVSLWVLEKNIMTNNEDQQPAPKKKHNSSRSNETGLRVIPMKYLTGFHWLGADEAVALEILPENIVAQLPPAMATKKYAMT